MRVSISVVGYEPKEFEVIGRQLGMIREAAEKVIRGFRHQVEEYIESGGEETSVVEVYRTSNHFNVGSQIKTVDECSRRILEILTSRLPGGWLGGNCNEVKTVPGGWSSMKLSNALEIVGCLGRIISEVEALKESYVGQPPEAFGGAREEDGEGTVDELLDHHEARYQKAVGCPMETVQECIEGITEIIIDSLGESWVKQAAERLLMGAGNG